MTKNIKFSNENKKIIVWVSTIIFWVLLLIYWLLVSFAHIIEINMTFVWKNYISQEYNEIELNFEEVNIDDGFWNNINWLYIEWSREETVYYFHGNWGPLKAFYWDIKYINELWYNIIAYDFPSYGKSWAYPYTETIQRFSQVFFDHIQKEKWIKNKDLIIWGFSVWAWIWADFASKNEVWKVILLAPFASKYDFVRSHIWFAIQKLFFLKDSFITKENLNKIDKPILIIHWNEDKIIPIINWKTLFYWYSREKYLVELDKQWHNFIIENFWISLKNIFSNFISWEDLFFESNYIFLDQELKDILELENSIDFYTDSSLEKFVSSDISFNNFEYIPEDLVSISSEFIYDSKWWTQLLRKEAKDALDILAEKFYEEFAKKFNVVSAYRSYANQKRIKDNWCSDNFCAKAWYSEHQTWLVVDIFEASTEISWKNNPTLLKYFLWMKINAHKYWWHNTYQKWLATDTYEIEPWHWRYLGVDFATYLYENDLTIAEYYNLKN